ncbi:hypothetical protein L596_014446 [Steinernema carpocapsae]|uniref:Uncharacterized protein n=1 Tax=Steinernema carpocapsae TaxID=34508 RepID=A0A4U5NCR1_STECR|nr:hypothetical protein L596_014446 [Steinernema carpocapsae]
MLEVSWQPPVYSSPLMAESAASSASAAPATPTGKFQRSRPTHSRAHSLGGPVSNLIKTLSSGRRSGFFSNLNGGMVSPEQSNANGSVGPYTVSLQWFWNF